jgi:CheY-like chemotaxis protein
LKELNDNNVCKNYWIDIDKARQNILDAMSNIDRSKLVVIANVTSRAKIEELNIDQEQVIYKPITLTKLKNILNKTADTTTKVLEETTAATATKFDAKILVTEDNIINQKLITRILQEHGATVDIANNGLESFEKRRNNSYDLLFMDIQMPVMDGIEATHEILDYEEDEEVAHVPIVALTANALKGDRERFLGEGMDEYITKPIETSELLYVLNKFLSHKAKIVLAGAEAETVETEDKVKAVSQEDETKSSIPDVELTPDESVEVAKDEPSEKIILIAKKFLIEKRVLTKVIENLGFDYKVLDDTDLLENELSSTSYDVLFTDKDLVTDSISKSDDNLAIITSVNSKEEIEALINTHRG